MSYILDALRRAQAERERGQVPGLNAQPLGPEPAAGAVRTLPAPALAAALLLLVVLALLWWWGSTPSTTPPPPAVGVPQVQPQPQAQAQAQPQPQPQLPIVVSAPPVTTPAQPQAQPQPQAPADPTTTPAPAPAPAATTPAAPPAAAATPPRPLTLAQLSAEQRRDLPPLSISGSVWSDNAASRFVIINGQLVHEGENAATGVVLERIAPKTALLRWRGLLIEVGL